MASDKFTEEEVVAASTEYFNGDDMAANNFLKYSLNSEGSYYEKTPDAMHKRLAKEFARIEKKYPNPMSEKEIYDLLKDFRYIVPQGSPMSAVGNDYQVQSLSNCFVVEGPVDSYGGILYTDQQQAQIMKRRGGVGFDISKIRPQGLVVKNAAKTTDGIGIFMERFSNTCREVGQNNRRGALMLTIDCHHPEIRTFIQIKNEINPKTGEREKVTGANVSIRWSDEFLEAVEKNEKVQLRFPVGEKENPLVEEWVDAKEIWEEFVHSAWDAAEPGCLFWDTATERTPADCYPSFASVSTNPCGEIILSPDDSCRLLIKNLLSYVLNPFTKKAKFDFELFRKNTIKAQRLMDDLIDLEIEAIDKIIDKVRSDPEPEAIKQLEIEMWLSIRKAASNGRRTGLGVTALGDTLAALGLKYGSKESIEMTESIYKALALASYRSSVDLAKERKPFPVFDHEKEKNHPFLNQIWEADSDLYHDYLKYGRRNIANTTTAPCGTVSTLTQTTSGIEPAIMIEYIRRKKINSLEDKDKADFVDSLGDSWQEFEVFHHGVTKWMEITGETDITKSPYFGATANEIDWVSAVTIQAAAQKWVCHAISKTINLPKEATEEDIHKVYWTGWKAGCKGLTVYREGSRAGVMVSKDSNNEKFVEHNAPRRPELLDCDIHHASIKGEKWVILVGLLDGKPYEVFGGRANKIELPKKYAKGKMKKHPRKTMQSIYDLILGEDDDRMVIKDVVEVFDNPDDAAFTRVISLTLRHGAKVKFLVEQLQKDTDTSFTSFSKVISRMLKKYIKDGEKASEKKCGNCEAEGTLIYMEGCVMCQSCGSSKCG